MRREAAPHRRRGTTSRVGVGLPNRIRVPQKKVCVIISAKHPFGISTSSLESCLKKAFSHFRMSFETFSDFPKIQRRLHVFKCCFVCGAESHFHETRSAFAQSFFLPILFFGFTENASAFVPNIEYLFIVITAPKRPRTTLTQNHD